MGGEYGYGTLGRKFKVKLVHEGWAWVLALTLEQKQNFTCPPSTL